MVEEKKEVFSNIFDAASKMERRKAVEKALSAGALARAEGEKGPSLTDEEITQKIQKYQELHNQIADKLDEMFVKSNISPKQLHDYFNSPQNFTADQWRLIEMQRQTIDKMLDQLLPERLKGEKIKPESEKSEKQRPKRMQVKSRWMPMH